MSRSLLVQRLGLVVAALAATAGTVVLAGPSEAGPLVVQATPPVQIDTRVYTSHTLAHWSSGATYDHEGNLYVAETWGGGLVRIAGSDHALTTVVPPATFTAAAASCGWAVPAGVAVDGSDRVFVSLAFCGVVLRVNGNGSVTKVAGGGTSTADSTPALDKKMGEADSLAFDSGGNLYIADAHDQKVYEVSGGQLTTVAGTGTKGYNGDGIAATSVELVSPFALAVDSTGGILIGETGRLRRFTPGGTISTVAGTGVSGYSGDGGAATSAEVSDILGITVNQFGTIIFSDRTNARIRMVSTTGTISTLVGTGVAGFNGDNLAPTATEVDWPHGVAVNPTNSYVSFVDANNGRARQVRPRSLFVPISG